MTRSAARRRVCVFTSTRADYGLLHWLLHDLASHPAVELQVLVSGTHLCPQFGDTWKAIAADGFPISARVEMVLDSDSGVGMATSLGLGVIRYADTLASLAPDILVVLGDRYETLAVASAAMSLRIPLAHLHGGETTEGVIDEAVRHAVTAMAHLHFPVAEAYARRIVQMGNDPARIFNVGAPGIDNLTRMELPDRETLERELDFRLGEQGLMVTYHPVTLSDIPSERLFGELLAALDRFPDSQVIITKANADAGGRAINVMIDGWAQARQGRVLAVPSLGQRRYLAALKAVAAVVGNSSSGIIEAPAVGRPVVNIGNRQKGRLRAPSVLDCAEEREAIAATIQHALTPAMRALAALAETPYGRGGASLQIAEVLASVPLNGLLNKSFRDLDFQCPDGRADRAAS